MESPYTPVYEPTSRVHEVMFPTLGDRKVGQRVKVTITFQVIEKTKSYTVLRIGYMLPAYEMRKI